MPAPTVRDVHIETALSNISIAFRNPIYIAEQVFPRVPVAKKTDYYFIFDKGPWFRDEVHIRAPGTRARRADYTLTTASYVCLTYATAKAVPDEVRENADTPLRPDVEATEFVTDQLIKKRERRVADVITGSANWAYSASPTTQWSSDTSDPLGDIETAKYNVVNNIGREPNVLVVSYAVWRYLKNHPDILDRIKYTERGVLTPEVAGQLFGIQKVLIGTAIYDKAQEGQTASQVYIWDDDAWVGYVPPAAALLTPAAGYVLEWQAREVRRYREDQERQDVIEASDSTAVVTTASDAGGILYDAV